MPKLTIDGYPVEVEAGVTLLEAARRLGIEVPTLCHVEGFEPSASCYLCAVQVEGRPALSPSCALPVADGMVVHTDTDDVRASRKMALELLLSDHVGDCMAPCRVGCPARLDIPGFTDRLGGGDSRGAAEIAADFLVLPASLGRICPRLCEERCHRCDLDAPLSVGSLHRFTADRDLASGSPYLPRKERSSGKRAAIVGAGPAGLAAAYGLLRRGHAVTVYDAHSQPGGMLRYGVPGFRLPRAILDAEIGVIRALGAEFRMGLRLGRDFSLKELRRRFDAVFLALGAQGSRGLGCPGEELALPAVKLLEQVAEAAPPPIAGDVLVVGGGNTALDAARTAVRLGARSVTVLYRRSRREMPCLMAEVEAAEEEGVRVSVLAAPKVLQRNSAGRLLLTCLRMELGPPDARGRPRPVPVEGSESTVEADWVIAAIGQEVEVPDPGANDLSRTERGITADQRTLATSIKGVFAGGDGVTGADFAVRAVAAGKLAAVSMDQYLRGRPVKGDPELMTVLMGKMGELELAALFREIEKSPRAEMPRLELERRRTTFEEVEQGLPLLEAVEEASRCMSCGCVKETSCRLRRLATEYGADPLRFEGARRGFQRDVSHREVVYEPGKCILCDACVKAAAEEGEELGLSIVGRGFLAAVGVPFGGTLAEGLQTAAAARRAAEVCPTGAIALRVAGPGHGGCSACALGGGTRAAASAGHRKEAIKHEGTSRDPPSGTGRPRGQPRGSAAPGSGL
jgi:formate dehydrogenase major subunit